MEPYLRPVKADFHTGNEDLVQKPEARQQTNCVYFVLTTKHFGAWKLHDEVLQLEEVVFNLYLNSSW